MKQTIVFFIRRLRLARLNRQATALLRRANAQYRPSAYQIGYVASASQTRRPVKQRSAWLPAAALMAAFMYGYVVADDKRVAEQDAASSRAVSACNTVRLADAGTAQDATREADHVAQ